MVLSGVLAASFKTSNLFLSFALTGIVITAAAWFLTGIRHVEQPGQEEKTVLTESSLP